MSKITKHNLQMQIDTLKGFRLSMQAEINNMKEWISNLEIEQTQPNVTLPKSTRYDAEVGSRLDSLEARMEMVEGMLKTSICDAMTKEIPEPQNIRKVVFVWRITEEGKLKRPVSDPNEFDTIEELFQLGDKAILFLAHFGQGASVNIYIGHYE
jgi:predicted nuclease with TOPRIM domain